MTALTNVMDEKTKEALEGSIKKWRDIVAGHGIDKGSLNCSLCNVFLDQESGDCKGCPVATKTGNLYCIGSPYDEWSNFEEEWLLATPINSIKDSPLRKEAEELAQAELDFLISLREVE